MPVLVAAVSPLAGPGPQARDIGPLYDLLISTRDGSTLPCKNKDGDVVNLSKVAFMTSASAQSVQHEETELMHKDQLTQYASSNLTDREFDQWPQVSQGDWSGGAGQRILTGATPLTSFGPQSDQTRYWDGEGVIWPINDFVPQRPVFADPDKRENGAVMVSDQIGIATGQLLNYQIGQNLFCHMYMQSTGAKNHILVAQSAVGTSTTLTNPFGSVAGTGLQGSTSDMMMALGYLWFWSTAGGNLTLYAWDGATVFTAATVAGGGPTNFGSFNRNTSMLAAGVAGNRSYLAMTVVAGVGNGIRVRLFDVTNQGAFPLSSFIDIPMATTSSTFPAGSWAVQQLEFLGDNLYVVIGDSSTRCFLIQYNIPSATASMVARWEGATDAYICPIAGGLFIITANNQNTTNPNIQATADIWMLQGSSLQHIGPLIINSLGGVLPFLSAFTNPAPFGPYAVFAAVWFSLANNFNSQASVFAYDVLRGRLFKLAVLPANFNSFLNIGYPRRLGVMGAQTHLVGGVTTIAEWAVIAFTLSDQSSPLDVQNVQRLLMRVSQNGSWQVSQQQANITSSLIDFTSAQNKLYRQVVLSFTPLPQDPTIGATLNIWLDQDPSSLNAAPDFTATITGTAANAGAKQLKLLVNRVARKLVYQALTSGPNLATPTGAVKLISVAVQAATGWARTMMLDLADRVQPNGKQPTDAWSLQQPPGQPALDGTAAYNFLRQLWRLKGGELLAAFPNGDVANWLLQDAHFDSPKPFGASFRADERSSLAYVCTLKMREDI